MVRLNDSQVERFSRQIILPELGAARQGALIEGSAAVVADTEVLELISVYLAAAGVGRTMALAPRKQGSAAEREEAGRLASLLVDHNPQARLEVCFAENAIGLAAKAGVVVCMDPAILRELSPACRRAKVPLLWGEAAKSYLLAGADCENSPCALCGRALARQSEGEAAEASLSPAPSLLASILAVEAIKVLAGLETALCGLLLRLDCGRWRFSRYKVAARAYCPICRPSGNWMGR